jgi:hypothetical protein
MADTTNGSTRAVASELSQIEISNKASPSTIAIHADDALNNDKVTDVAPALHVSTTFRYPRDLSKLIPFNEAQLAGEVSFPFSYLADRKLRLKYRLPMMPLYTYIRDIQPQIPPDSKLFLLRSLVLLL